MIPPQHRKSSEVEHRIESALQTLADLRNHALDVLRCDDARWIVRREREDLLNRKDFKKEILEDWAELVRTEKEFLLGEFEWITEHTKLDFHKLSQNLAKTFENIPHHTRPRLPNVDPRLVVGIPEEMQQVLHQIPYNLSRQFVIPNYQELSSLNPITIDPQWFCRVISEHEVRREAPFSVRRLFEGEVKALLMERSGRVIGGVLWDATTMSAGHSMELLGLWVTPLERRDGVASALIKRAAKIALRAGKTSLTARLVTSQFDIRDVLSANGFYPLHSHGTSRADTKLVCAYRAKISDVFHSDECYGDLLDKFTMFCGGSDIAGSLCRARRSLLRLSCPRPSKSSVFKRVIADLHYEDQLSGKERDITVCRNTSQLRYNAKLQSLQAQTREIKRLISHDRGTEYSQNGATRYFSHILSDLSIETRPDDFCAAITQLGTVQWKFLPTLSRASFGHSVSLLDEDLLSQVLDLQVESQHSALISDVHDLRALLSSEDVVMLGTCKETTLTGISIGSLIEESLVFHQLVVDERYRKAGYGRSLVNAMIAHAVFLRAKSVVVSLSERNEAAINLFASCGFIARLVPTQKSATRDSYRFTLQLTEKG
jgi:GNAT superfamily N-acetyltransferase